AAVHRATRTAALLEARGEFFERLARERHAADHRHALASAALGLASDAHDAVAPGRDGLGGLAALAAAHGERPAALRADASGAGGIDESRGRHRCGKREPWKP